jgi:hypothetical protein
MYRRGHVAAQYAHAHHALETLHPHASCNGIHHT